MDDLTKPVRVGLILLGFAAGCSGGAQPPPGKGDLARSVDAAGEDPLVMAAEVVEPDVPGVETAVALDPSGAPHVLYFAPTTMTRPCKISASTTQYTLNALYHSTRAGASSGAWGRLTVEVGAEPYGSGLVIDPSTQKPVVAYLGGHTGDATESPPGNYCGSSDARIGRYTGAAWTLSTVATHSTAGTTAVDTSGNVVGVWSALQIDSKGMWYLAFQDTHYNIANSDFNGADLELARGQGGTGWQFGEQVSNAGAGDFTTMALDAQDRPVLAYGGYLDGGVTVALRQGASQWQVLRCSNGQPAVKGHCAQAGQVRSSIAVAPISKRIGVAYHDDVYKLLRLIESSDGGATWSTPVVVDKDGDCGFNVSLRYDKQDRAVLAYYDRGDYSMGGADPATDAVRVARQSTTDPTVFAVTSVDTGGALACGAYASLAIGADGKAAIAYQCNMQGATPGTYKSVVKYAYQQN